MNATMYNACRALLCLPVLGLLLVSGPQATAQPANDDFGDAQLISGPSGSVTEDSTGALKEIGEPNHATKAGGASVWFVWEAPTTGVATFDTFLPETSFDTLLAAYTGNDVASLTTVAYDDGYNGAINSLIRFPVQQGVAYYIAVDGNSGLSGNYGLKWSMAPLPSNDNFANAQIISGTNGSVNGYNIGATKEPGEPNHAFNPGGSSIWYRWTAPISGPALFTTTFSLDTTANSAPGGTLLDTLIGVYTGTSVGSLTLVGTNDNVTGSVRARVQVNVVAGTTYRIVIDGKVLPTGVARGNTVLTWSVGVPPNNNFANAQLVSGECGTLSSANIFANKETGEPALAGNAGGASVWYKWTAPVDGPATFNTFGSRIDTLLGVFTGAAVNALTLVGDNDDADISTPFSQVDFAATAGTTYYIVVDGYQAGANLFNLTWGSGIPINDEFFNAETISGSTGSVAACNFFATKDFGEPDLASNPGGHSVWYQWVPPQNGVVTFNTRGSLFDTLLGAYTGGSVDSLTPVADNDDIVLGVIQSEISFFAEAGVTYSISVDGFGGDAGLVKLTWSLLAPPVLHITPEAGGFKIDWAGPFHLESTTALLPGGGSTWTPVAGGSPVAVPNGGSSLFFRAVYP